MGDSVERHHPSVTQDIVAKFGSQVSPVGEFYILCTDEVLKLQEKVYAFCYLAPAGEQDVVTSYIQIFAPNGCLMYLKVYLYFSLLLSTKV